MVEVLLGADAEACLWPGSARRESASPGFPRADRERACYRGADDLPRNGRPELGYTRNELLDIDALPERVFALEEFGDEVLIDEGDFDGGCVVLVSEGATGKKLNAVGPGSSRA